MWLNCSAPKCAATSVFPRAGFGAHSVFSCWTALGGPQALSGLEVSPTALSYVFHTVRSSTLASRLRYYSPSFLLKWFFFTGDGFQICALMTKQDSELL